MKNLLLLITLLVLAFTTSKAQVFEKKAGIAHIVKTANPLDNLVILGTQGQTVSISDGKGKEYFRSTSKPELHFVVSGALGIFTS